MPTLLVQPRRLKETRGLSSFFPGQCASNCFPNLEGTIPDPQVLTVGQPKPNLAFLWRLFYFYIPLHICFHPSSPFCRYQHFGSTKAFGKKTTGSIIIFPRSMRFKMFPKLAGNHSRPTGADCWPVITQFSVPLTPLLLLHLSARVFIHHLHSVDANTFGSTKAFGKKQGLSWFSPGQCVSNCF